MILPTEAKSRREDFVTGRWVRLADGDLWCFPKLSPSGLVPIAGGLDTVFDFGIEGREYDPEFDASVYDVVRQFRECTDGHADACEGSVRVTYLVVRTLAVLLRANYDIPITDAMVLIYYGFHANGDFAGAAEATHELHEELEAIVCRLKIAFSAEEN